jgi:hypothetical protein
VAEGSVDSQWYTVRCVFQSDADDGFAYEERVTLWQAASFDQAISLAEAEASEYAAHVQVKYVGLAQAYLLSDPDSPISGAEVFSLVRDSDLAPNDYLNRFFDTGRERQGHWPEL